MSLPKSTNLYLDVFPGISTVPPVSVVNLIQSAVPMLEFLEGGRLPSKSSCSSSAKSRRFSGGVGAVVSVGSIMSIHFSNIVPSIFESSSIKLKFGSHFRIQSMTRVPVPTALGSVTSCLTKGGLGASLFAICPITYFPNTTSRDNLSESL